MRNILAMVMMLAIATPAPAQYGFGVGAYRGPYYGGFAGPFYGYVPGAYNGFWSNGYSLYGPPVPTYGSIPGSFGGGDQRLSNFPDLNYWWPGPYGYRGAYVPLGRTTNVICVAPLATCEIRLPVADAEVFVNGERVDGAGDVRQFRTSIPPRVGSSCEIEARWSTADSIGSARRTVILRAGETAVADFVSSDLQALTGAGEGRLLHLPQPLPKKESR